MKGCDGRGRWIFSRTNLKTESSLLISIYFCTRKTNNRLIHSVRGEKTYDICKRRMEGEKEKSTVLFGSSEPYFSSLGKLLIAGSSQRTREDVLPLGNGSSSKRASPAVCGFSERLRVYRWPWAQAACYVRCLNYCLSQLRYTCTISFIRTSQYELGELTLLLSTGPRT